MYLRNAIMKAASRLPASPLNQPVSRIPAEYSVTACTRPPVFPSETNEIDSGLNSGRQTANADQSGMIRIHFTGYSQKAAIYRPPFFISSNASAQNKRPGDL
ncbi:hypothetical protein [Chitinilyticum piscinae]|uniref:Uncharacterized protein n=1 Tax=Chitinilyticum piscinae TaxID=2866724 RepID=A0A8J7FL21_9NEIS|nr:hypothetical protein [Chitinilyticum piscinae]MBE9610022.1 hypothetical protein [Chitinilyticum piscinae]